MNNAVARFLEQHGRDIEHTYYTKVDETDYGEEYESDTETLTGRINRQGTVLQDRSEHSAAVEVGAVIYLKISDEENVADGGGDRASEFVVDGEKYIALQVDDQDNGLLRVDCERER